MLVEVGSSLNFFEKETLGQMGKEESKAGDVEEGEIPDTVSVEEISEDDFRKVEGVRILGESRSGQDSNKNTRTWAVHDLYKKYPSMCGGYSSASGLYNLAWASAVQNKSLKEMLVMEKDPNSKDTSSVAPVTSKEDKISVEDEELEEGEIDLDSEPVEREVAEADNVINLDSETDLEKKLNSVRGILEGITVTEAEKSLVEVCSKLQNALDILQQLVPKNNPIMNLAFGAVNSVFLAVNYNMKEQNKGIVSRLLSDLRSNDPPLFSDSQIKEIDVMLLSLDSHGRANHQENDNKKGSHAFVENSGQDVSSTYKLPLSVESIAHNKPNMSLQTLKSELTSFRNRGPVLPLLDLHKDHDEDSLPSPTRETTQTFPVLKSVGVGDMMARPGSFVSKAANVAEATRRHPYDTDAFKAVSSYQQKFGRGSFFSTDRLPSPTPSDESGDAGGDIGGEVSSSGRVGNFKLNPSVSGQSTVSFPLQTDSISSSVKVQAAPGPAPFVSSGQNPPSKVSAKSRDPRLRFANSDVIDPRLRFANSDVTSRKHKSVEESIPDTPAPKRQRNEVHGSGFVRGTSNVSGTGGWLEDTDLVGSQVTGREQTIENAYSNSRRMENGVSCSVTVSPNTHVAVGGNEQLQIPVTSTSTPSLPFSLKELAVNPTALVNFLMGKQQRLASESQSKSTGPLVSPLHHPSFSSVVGVFPAVNAASSDQSVSLPKPAGILPVKSEDDSGKIRMKPRDPRRVLHGNILQKAVGSGPEQFKTNGPPTPNTQGSKDNILTQKLEGQLGSKPFQSLSIPPPDIGQQFTNNLKNIADIMSVSKPLPSPVSQPLASQAVQNKSDKADKKLVPSNLEDRRTVAGSTPEISATVPHPQNAWGDVAHLLEGYDDQQRAAIQRERSRRIEEQKKMFAVRKLVLVLDLDHTLLNSAKFVEVDPVHEEILRKKEEIDREKPHRHLYRFAHMGMWTKLRPGVWNFLEKASKLFELHLYTMGNKLYATEMAKVLDPKGTLFAGRVLSRGDDGDPFDGDERVPKSKDLEGVLGMESAVIIIDDSVRVWPHNKLNLIAVERYTYFPCSRRQFGLPGPSLLEIDHDERPEEGTLASSLAVIERIHQQFFSHRDLDDVDVRNILADEQRKILAGCRIVFSRIFPVGEANPHLHPLWQTAEQFGAVCTTQIDEQVTHVVANSLGTDKVNWALANGRFVVYPGWVEASALLYRRANEHNFVVK